MYRERAARKREKNEPASDRRAGYGRWVAVGLVLLGGLLIGMALAAATWGRGTDFQMYAGPLV